MDELMNSMKGKHEARTEAGRCRLYRPTDLFSCKMVALRWHR